MSGSWVAVVAWARAWARVCACLLVLLVLVIGSPAAAAGADLHRLFYLNDMLTGAGCGPIVDQRGSNFRDHNLTGTGQRSKARPAKQGQQSKARPAKQGQRSKASEARPKKSIKTRVCAKNADAGGRARARGRAGAAP